VYTLQELGDQIRAAREDRKLSQPELAASITPPTNRSAIAHLEQGRRIASPQVLEGICEYLQIPSRYWKPFTEPENLVRLNFEEAISELIGRPVTLRFHDEHSAVVAQDSIKNLFRLDYTDEQARDALNSILVYYDVPPMSREFFTRYFSDDAVKSPESLLKSVRRFQAEAIRIFSTFGEAYRSLNEDGRLGFYLEPLASRSLDWYRNRRPWDVIETIPEERLPDLGYISAARARQEAEERRELADFLLDLADKIESEGKAAIDGYTERKRRRMGSLLRKFNSRFEHDLMSPLFSPDGDAIRREASAIAPKEEGDLARIEQTQAQAQRNLAKYLAADYLDVYVATSMRTNADFVSVSAFVRNLFSHEEVRPLKLRYFNPTQSWIDDRVAKGLVEALMLKRSSLTIFMAQKSDTFGKDSEASVALGQGKPVIVFVPKWVWPDANIDSEMLSAKGKADLEQLVAQEGSEEDREFDPTMDNESLLGRLLTLRLNAIQSRGIAPLVRAHWADFDLYSEDVRIENAETRIKYRQWLDIVTQEGQSEEPSAEIRDHLIGILVAVSIRFEGRARLFREQHPLALQVILSTGVLNGILVARSVDSCASLLSSLMRNELDLELREDEWNYRLVERTTGSTIRVISRNTLIVNAFSAFYARQRVWRDQHPVDGEHVIAVNGRRRIRS
jgi:transcriptional regulator with XRE-family HTH domain